MNNQSNKLIKLTIAGVLTGLIIIMSYVPFLGYIPLGFMNATILHIPVIIGAVVLGPVYGGFLGLVFGITSVLKNTFSPNLTSFVFSPFYSVGEFGGNACSLIVSLVPRILIGVVSYYVFVGLRHLLTKPGRKNMTIPSLILAGVAGSLTNTILVMNFIYIFFGQSYALASERAFSTLYTYILAVIVGSGIPEAIVAGVLTGIIGNIMLKVTHLNQYQRD